MGIAVNTDNWSGVVAINNQGNTAAWSTAYAFSNSYASSDTTLYNGREITETAAADGVNAPKIANDYTFVNGQTGYLPSYIEAEILINRMVGINDAITKVGGTAITEAWTCAKPTNSDTRYIYKFGVNGMVEAMGIVLNKSYFRPITELPEGLEW